MTIFGIVSSSYNDATFCEEFKYLVNHLRTRLRVQSFDCVMITVKFSSARK